MRTGAASLLPALAIAATLLLAGCSSDDPDAQPAVVPSAETVAATSTDATDIPFSIAVGAGTPAAGANAPPPGSLRGGPFDVPDGSSLLVIDAEWSCASGPACGLAIVVYDDDGEVVETVEGSGTVHIEIGTPAAGEWGVSAMASAQGSAVAQAEGTFHVAVTHT